MAHQILTTAELNSYLTEVTRRLYDCNVFCGQNAEIMYKMGIRFAELSGERWLYLGSSFQMRPLKGNKRRFFLHNEIPNYMYRLLIEFDQYYPLMSYSYFTNKFKLVRPYPIFLGKKQILAESYRHLYARRLKESGMTDEEIRQELGEETQAAADHYIYSIIYKKDET